MKMAPKYEEEPNNEDNPKMKMTSFRKLYLARADTTLVVLVAFTET